MSDTDKYEDAKKTVEDAGLIDDNDGWLDVHYRKIAHLLAEVKRLQKRNEWLEEVVALAQEHGGIDLSDYRWQWEEE
jgi:hypothetical protein